MTDGLDIYTKKNSHSYPKLGKYNLNLQGNETGSASGFKLVVNVCNAET